MAFVERTPDDDAAQSGLLHAADIVQRGDAAGGDDVEPGSTGKFCRRLDVDAAAHTVAGDVGEAKPASPHLGEARCQLQGCERGGFLPAVHLHEAVARVDTHGDTC